MSDKGYYVNQEVKMEDLIKSLLIKTLDEIWKYYEAEKLSIIDFFCSGYKHFNKKAKRKEAEQMQGDLDKKRESIEKIKQLIDEGQWVA